MAKCVAGIVLTVMEMVLSSVNLKPTRSGIFPAKRLGKFSLVQPHSSFPVRAMTDYKKYREEWADLSRNGLTHQEISDKYGCDRTTVSRHLREYDGIKTREQYSVEERFWDKVDVGEEDECWEWQTSARCSGGNYASFRDGYDTEAHRTAYRLVKGVIPDGYDVRHTCHNKICQNPNHLELGTRKENMNDSKEDNRLARGEKLSKLTNEDVREIRNRYKNEDISYAKLAEDYPVEKMSICRIVNRDTWTHI